MYMSSLTNRSFLTGKRVLGFTPSSAFNNDPEQALSLSICLSSFHSVYCFPFLALLLEMLRLASTRITLDSSDVAWHTRRHEKRLARPDDGKQFKDTIREADAPPQSPGSTFEHVVDETPQEEIPIYSDEPVPRESQAFWNTIVADAGTSARVHLESLARSPQLIVPSETFLENNGSVRLSIRGENEDEYDQTREVVPLQELLISPRSPLSDPGSTPSTEVQSRFSTLFLPSLNGDENRQESRSRQTSSDQSDLLEKEDVDSDVTFDNHPSRSLVIRLPDSQPPWANQMDVDGPSDTAPRFQHHRSASSLQDPEPGSIGMPFGAQARKAELVASRNASMANLDANNASRDAGSGASAQAFPARHAGQHQTVHSRASSGGFQRSRLYISEAAASSSPDKRQTPPSELNDDLNLLSLPPRRRQGYKRRSETYSHVAPQASTTRAENLQADFASNNPFNTHEDNYSPARRGNLEHSPTVHDDYTISSPPQLIRYHTNNSFSSPRSIHSQYLTSSPYDRSGLSQSHHSSSAYPSSMSPHSRDPSMELPSFPNGSTFPSPNPLRRPFEPLTLPLNVTSRIPSGTAAFPPNHPTAAENGRYPGSPYLPSTPPRSISTTSIHHTPTRLSIYNDNRPADEQPQTPIGLPRNGLPPISLQNPFFTAPARAGASRRTGVTGWLHSAFATPSRAERMREVGGWGRGQENVGIEVEAARAERERVEQEERRSVTRSGRTWRMSDWEQ